MSKVSSIKSIDAARLGVPQKTALQIGVELLREVQVDEAIKPELLDAFEQVQAPIVELITWLAEQVNHLEDRIEALNPGTLATEALLQTEAYQSVIQMVEDTKPSALLAPLKTAHAELVALVQRLDPQVLIDALQQLYDPLMEFVNALDPDMLKEPIEQAVNTAVARLEQIKTSDLDTLIAVDRDAAALDALLPDAALQEMVDNEVWQGLKTLFDGTYLDRALDMLEQMGAQLASSQTLFDTRFLVAQADSGTAEGADDRSWMEAQSDVSESGLRDAFNALNGQIDALMERLPTLEAQRQQLLATSSDAEIAALLTDLDLAPLLNLSATVQTVLNLDASTLSARLEDIAALLQTRGPALENLRDGTQQLTLETLFKQHIDAPIRELLGPRACELRCNPWPKL